jgi:hypothetical protein
MAPFDHNLRPIDDDLGFQQFDGVLKRTLQQLWRKVQRVDAAAAGHSRHHAIRDEVEHVDQVHVCRDAVLLHQVVTVQPAVTIPPSRFLEAGQEISVEPVNVRELVRVVCDGLPGD